MRIWKLHQFYCDVSSNDFCKSNNWVAYDDVEDAFDHLEIAKENDTEMDFDYRVERSEMDNDEFNSLREFEDF